MRVRFWGVRGSVPYATSASIGYGCNTPCLEVIDDASGGRLILDAGSGIVGAGATPDRASHVSLLLTHYHWDHIQGLPFFSPLHRDGSTVTIHAPLLGDQAGDLRAIFESPFFPVPYDRLRSRPSIRMHGTGAVEVAGFTVAAHPLNHPGGALAYRISGPDGDLVYATDHEFGSADADLALAHFSRGASAIVLDAHFTPEEIGAHRGWGHSDWLACARFASQCGARRLRLFHHKPGRTDVEIDGIVAAARAVFPATQAAKEGDELAI
jgi:phosphoribosyl 1,2-cyclic phosphodiesterase